LRPGQVLSASEIRINQIKSIGAKKKADLTDLPSLPTSRSSASCCSNWGPQDHHHTWRTFIRARAIRHMIKATTAAADTERELKPGDRHRLFLIEAEYETASAYFKQAQQE